MKGNNMPSTGPPGNCYPIYEPATLEHTLAGEQRRRVLAQLGLQFAELTAPQSAAIDTICGVLPVADEPNILAKANDQQRTTIETQLAALPSTVEIQKLQAGHWPE
jgi:hypothetical protein